jgi:fluoroacetyl-CoA thioesterase
MADLQVGMIFEKTMTVTESLAARHLEGAREGEGVRVLSTPEMVRFVEICALEGVREFLQPGQETVGTRVDIRHLAATPVGMRVTARCTLTEIDRRRLTFRFEVQDELDKVGEGTHERFIVDLEKQQVRLKDKVNRWKTPR